VFVSTLNHRVRHIEASSLVIERQRTGLGHAVAAVFRRLMQLARFHMRSLCLQ
jgi:hypothetical protein